MAGGIDGLSGFWAGLGLVLTFIISRGWELGSVAKAISVAYLFTFKMCLYDSFLEPLGVNSPTLPALIRGASSGIESPICENLVAECC